MRCFLKLKLHGVLSKYLCWFPWRGFGRGGVCYKEKEVSLARATTSFKHFGFVLFVRYCSISLLVNLGVEVKVGVTVVLFGRGGILGEKHHGLACKGDVLQVLKRLQPDQ